jgi:peptidoglycan/xylan/chitin deacetylase (PgdA/CDA1 family)
VNREKKFILLTFDYELFLGERSGTVENCLIIPTQQILEVLHRLNAKAVFFIDTIYIHYLKQMAQLHQRAKEDYERIKRQLLQIAEVGHYLFHHLHPHWRDVIYLPEINQWKSETYDHFAMASLTNEERQMMFSHSASVMDEIFHQPAFEHNGFRAGGLYVQPFSDLVDGFNRLNIKYDFSVLPGFKSDEAHHRFDFSNAKQSTPYSFRYDVLQPDADGTFFEFPISTLDAPPFSKIINAVIQRIAAKNFSASKWGDGSGSKNKIFPAAMNGVPRIKEICSVESLNPYRQRVYDAYLKKHEYMHIISHPKLISKLQLKLLEKLLQNACKKYNTEFDFKQFNLNSSTNDTA